MGFFWTIVVLVIALGLAWRYLGSYMAAVFDGRVHFLGWAERPVYRLLGTEPGAGADLEALRRLRGHLLGRLDRRSPTLIIRIQGSLPLNPQHLGAVPPALSFNTAVVVRDQHQLAELRRRDDHVVLLADRRAHRPAVRDARRSASPWPSPSSGASPAGTPRPIGNFWVDITRCLLYILLPIAFVAGIIFVGQGAVQTLAGPVSIHNVAQRGHPDDRPGPDRLHGGHQAAGHQRRWVPQRQLGHPFENPTGLTNWLSIFLLLSIPFALTYTFGKMVGSIRHGAALLAAMVHHLRGLGRLHQLRRAPGQPGRGGGRRPLRPTGTPWARRSASVTPAPPCSACRRPRPPPGRPTAPTTRSPRWAASACMTGMMLGEVTPGGVGQWALHHPHLRHHRRVHRRPDDRANTGVPGEEDPGQGGEAGRAWAPWSCRSSCSSSPAIAVSIHAGRAGPLNAGPHGFTEILYALTSQGNNNGSAFGGPDRQHRLLQHPRRHRHADRPVRDHDPGPGPGRGAGGQERGARRRSAPSGPTTACSSA